MHALHRQQARVYGGCQQRKLAQCARRPRPVPAARTRTVTRATTVPVQLPRDDAQFKPSELVKVIFPDDDKFDQLEKDVIADICYPQTKDGATATPLGGILFMHGFSQLPKSYYRTMQDLASNGYLVIAPYGGRQALGGEADLTSPKVMAIIKTLDESRESRGVGAKLRYATQLALKQDGQQCIKFLTKPGKATMKFADDNRTTTLATYLPSGVTKIGVCGHSMGAGLSFSLGSEYPSVAAIGVMAPMIHLEPAFDPLKEVVEPTFKDKDVLLLSGGLDFIAWPSDVRKLFEKINTRPGENTVTYEDLSGYFHTSFEDQLTLGDYTLTALVGGALAGLNVLAKVLGLDGDGPWWEVSLGSIQFALWIAYTYLVDIRPKFIQGKRSRSKLVDFFTSKLK